MRVFISSPEGLELARSVIEDEIKAFAERQAPHESPPISVVEWPHEIAAGVADYSQSVINSQTSDHDILVCLVGTRMGSPTPRASSGTEEEFDRTIDAVRRGEAKQALIFFSNLPVRPADVDPHQLLLVKAFREKTVRLGVLYHVFDDYDELRALFRRSFREAYASAAAHVSGRSPSHPEAGVLTAPVTVELGDLAFRDQETAPQRADVQMLPLAEYRGLPFAVEGRLCALTPYFRFGFKYFDSREQLFSSGSVQTFGNNLLIHLGRNRLGKLWFYTIYRAGLRMGPDRPIPESADWAEADLRLEVAPAGRLSLRINDQLAHQLFFVMDGIPVLALLGWSDEHTFRCALRGAKLTVGPGGTMQS